MNYFFFLGVFWLEVCIIVRHLHSILFWNGSFIHWLFVRTSHMLTLLLLFAYKFQKKKRKLPYLSLEIPICFSLISSKLLHMNSSKMLHFLNSWKSFFTVRKIKHLFDYGINEQKIYQPESSFNVYDLLAFKQWIWMLFLSMHLIMIKTLYTIETNLNGFGLNCCNDNIN